MTSRLRINPSIYLPPVFTYLINLDYLLRSSPGGQCTRRAIPETKQHSQRSVIGWVKIYNLELLRASEGTFSRWFQSVTKKLLSEAFSCLGKHFKPLVPADFAIVSSH
jgi:hypothetical protein